MKINEALQCCIELSESHVSTTLFPPSWPCQSSSSRPKVRENGRRVDLRAAAETAAHHICVYTRTRHRAPSSSHAQPNRSFQAAAAAAASSQPQNVRTSLPILALSPNISTWPNALKETFKKKSSIRPLFFRCSWNCMKQLRMRRYFWNGLLIKCQLENFFFPNFKMSPFSRNALPYWDRMLACLITL